MSDDQKYKLDFEPPGPGQILRVRAKILPGATLGTPLALNLKTDGFSKEQKLIDDPSATRLFLVDSANTKKIELIMTTAGGVDGAVRVEYEFEDVPNPPTESNSAPGGQSESAADPGAAQIGVTGDAIFWDLGEASEFEFLTNARPTHIHGYSALEHDVPLEQLSKAIDSGYQVMLTIEPWAAGNFDSPASAIAGGKMDEHLRRWARGLMQLDEPILLRFMHEMNGNWYPWSIGWKGNSPASVVDAYIHAWHLFEEEGATDLEWVWSPNIGAPVGIRYVDLYPGDDFIDYVGLDGYNGGTDVPQMGGWRTFEDTFSTSIAEVSQLTNRRIIIAETASSGSGGDKSAWISEMFDYIETTPQIYALFWFQIDKTAQGETDWRFNSDRASNHTFSEGIRRLKAS